MDTSQQTAVVPKDRESAVVLKRQRRSIAEKRRIVEETLVEGASVARVARAHGVNANQVFYWRTGRAIGHNDRGSVVAGSGDGEEFSAEHDFAAGTSLVSAIVLRHHSHRTAPGTGAH